MFTKHDFSTNQIKKYFSAALKDFSIAQKSKIPEVIFKFSYDALVKSMIALCAANNLRLKSRVGHHVKLLEKSAKLLGFSDLELIGNDMHMKRNKDLYFGGTVISIKEAKDYLNYVKEVLEKIEDYLAQQKRLIKK